MMATLALRLFPWFLVVILLFYLFDRRFAPAEPSRESIATTILTEVESLGKLELAKYHFQEIIEVTKVSEKYLKLFALDRDSKIVLIAQGSATACVDLTKLSMDDISLDQDAIDITLPTPEICNYKLDLQNSRIYSLETGYYLDEEKFIEEAYRTAESQVREAALHSGILDQAEVMGHSLLGPMLTKLTGKEVRISYRLSHRLQLR